MRPASTSLSAPFFLESDTKTNAIKIYIEWCLGVGLAESRFACFQETKQGGGFIEGKQGMSNRSLAGNTIK